MTTKRKINPNPADKLAPVQEFKKALLKVFSNSKSESDRQLARFQSSNAKKREAKKRG